MGRWDLSIRPRFDDISRTFLEEGDRQTHTQTQRETEWERDREANKFNVVFACDLNPTQDCCHDCSATGPSDLVEGMGTLNVDYFGPNSTYVIQPLLCVSVAVASVSARCFLRLTDESSSISPFV